VSELKLTGALVAKLRDRQQAGLSLRELSAWLLATEGVSASHNSIRLALAKPGKALRRAATGARTAPKAPDGSLVPPTPPSPPEGDGEAVRKARAEIQSGAVVPVPAEEVFRRVGVAGGSDQDDAEVYDRVIAETEEDIAAIRDQGGSPQALAVLRRLHADLLERRRKLRPPAVEPEVDAEMMAAGDRAVSKLRSLVEAERERAGV
jgi:hypothetical protein